MLPVFQSDISPEDSQMHDWIEAAARSNKFSIVHEGGVNSMFRVITLTVSTYSTQLIRWCNADVAHLEAKIKAGGFTVDIRWEVITS